ncbi:hypothetical protein DHW03_16335 [Pedobacter yonginense]|uniref:CHAT domain-containing protein n=1 Tax=Pedobacter yonginense TaxID=651869 RepID=A0A317EMS7_9SPHI|nr:CHAT domain-containing tetratricopeptide repeat protein [Pedobacter yonginense]PWS26348.1 hypothetical protein DHW03_16335 [Pedobacter yonginense]
MFKKGILLLSLFVLSTVVQGQVSEYKKQYALAEHYANAAKPTDATDAQALKHYLKAIQILSSTQKDNVFLFKTFVDVGAFMQVLDRQDEAIHFYRQSFKLKNRIIGLSDSVLFAPYVYCGNAYFKKDKPDSAQYFYLKAKEIAEQFPKVDEQERLFNTLGVMAYATGNYNKSVPYYEKAISVLNKKSNFDKSLLLTYQSNLASALRKLKRYDESFRMYKSLLNYGLEMESINHNMASAYLAVNKPDSALLYFSKLKVRNPKMLNDMAQAYLAKRDPLKALHYLGLSKEISKKNGLNNVYGQALKLTGDACILKKQFKRGISFYQYAIQSFNPNFNPKYLNQSPKDFSGVFNTIDLLETFVAKANAQRLMYQRSHRMEYLVGCLETYDSFYALADRVTKFYDNDEARLLIGNRKYTVHQDAIEVCLRLFKLTKRANYLEKAFYLDEGNKASVLSLSKDELASRANSKAPKVLLSLENQLKNNITRISLMASAEVNQKKLSDFKQVLNDDIIKLTNVQLKINQADQRTSTTVDGGKINLQNFQKSIPSDAAVLSYHFGNTQILCFVLTRDKFEAFTSPIGANFNSNLAQLAQVLRLKEGNYKKAIEQSSRQIYRALIEPASKQLSGIENLYIIPDDRLNQLPFEILIDGDGAQLIDKFAITYNYSCKILQTAKNEPASNRVKTLGFAPFNSSGSKMWPILSRSSEEIQRSDGLKLLGKSASKQQFLKQAHHFEIIHLATHAIADNVHPEHSYIAFYPNNADSTLRTRLYLPEIYNLKLREAKLVILSACESGNGAAVNGEGIMSLARAFSYAGCNNIITSMWNADDASTAVILSQFHQHLADGQSFASALKQSKLDYIADSQISPARKNQAYWAHLRFIGGFEVESETRKIWVYFLMIPFCIGLALISRKMFKKFREA